MSLPPGATLVSGQVPMALPAGATLVSGGTSQGNQSSTHQGASQQQQNGPITPLPGESFADTMKRAVAFGKTVTPDDLSDSYHSGIKKIPTVLGASLLAGPAVIGGLATAPEAASSAAGGGVLGSAAGGATGGAITELLNKGLHAASGEDVLTPESGMDVMKSAVAGGAIGGGLGLFGSVANSVLASKLSRGMINESLGATARDVTYGNPAKAILDEGITSPITGDIEAYKDALRAGKPPGQALVAAGGRTAQVAQKINELSPQLDQALANSAATIPVSDIIDAPLEKSMNDIISNRAMTEAEKEGAITQLGALQKSLKEGLGDTVTPLQANQIKQAIGNRINWAGNIAVTDEVKPAYRGVYGAIKSAVNGAVPEAAPLNERLTNLLAAQTDLEKLMKAEEVGQGKGALGSAVTGIARRAEALAGRATPFASSTAKTVTNAAPFVPGASMAALSTLMGGTDGQQ